MTVAGPILELTGVSRAFAQAGGAVTALEDIHLRVQPGEFIALLGPSGSGKSTLLNLAALLDRPTRGRLAFEGQDTSAMGESALCRWRARRIGMVFQRFHLLTRRSVIDNVRMRFRYLDTPRAEAAAASDRALAKVDLAPLARRRAGVLSGGEMQRVAIARAVAATPALLVADEPTGNLDPANTRRVLDIFAGLHREGVTILMATHNPALLAPCTRRIRLAAGRIEEDS